MMTTLRILTISLAAIFSQVGAAISQPCGGPDEPCLIEGGSYHLIYPDVTPTGIVMHLHGGGGNGRGMLSSDLAAVAAARGYVFIAPNGEHPEAPWTKDWSVAADGMVHERNDIAFLDAVMSDVRAKYPLTDMPFLLAGFSRGGSMVWNIACESPDFADAYAPLAGAFWERLPKTCKAPVRLFHTHGWTDRVVPLEGRSFFDGTVVQGDVWASLDVLRKTTGCRNRQPQTSNFVGDHWLRHWTDCDAGRIDLLLHKGGHSAPKGWANTIVQWFEAL